MRVHRQDEGDFPLKDLLTCQLPNDFGVCLPVIDFVFCKHAGELCSCISPTDALLEWQTLELLATVAGKHDKAAFGEDYGSYCAAWEV
jgi:hypothetical protein